MSNDFAIQATFEAEMQRRHERAEMIDEKCTQAMEVMNVCLETIQTALTEHGATVEQIIGLTEQAAKLGDAMARMKTCMNYPAWAPMGYTV